jgi:hypothetical protein
MPLTLLDIPQLLGPAGVVVKRVASALRKNSAGGGKVTKAEAREIGEAFLALGKKFLDAAAD